MGIESQKTGESGTWVWSLNQDDQEDHNTLPSENDPLDHLESA